MIEDILIWDIMLTLDWNADCGCVLASAYTTQDKLYT